MYPGLFVSNRTDPFGMIDCQIDIAVGHDSNVKEFLGDIPDGTGACEGYVAGFACGRPNEEDYPEDVLPGLVDLPPLVPNHSPPDDPQLADRIIVVGNGGLRDYNRPPDVAVRDWERMHRYVQMSRNVLHQYETAWEKSKAMCECCDYVHIYIHFPGMDWMSPDDYLDALAAGMADKYDVDLETKRDQLDVMLGDGDPLHVRRKCP